MLPFFSILHFHSILGVALLLHIALPFYSFLTLVLHISQNHMTVSSSYSSGCFQSFRYHLTPQVCKHIEKTERQICDASQPRLNWPLYFKKKKCFFLQKSSKRETILNYDKIKPLSLNHFTFSAIFQLEVQAGQPASKGG